MAIAARTEAGCATIGRSRSALGRTTYRPAKSQRLPDETCYSNGMPHLHLLEGVQRCPYELEISTTTEFVWLDIVCIDQRWGSMAAMEIGRQEDIIRNDSGIAI